MRVAVLYNAAGAFIKKVSLWDTGELRWSSSELNLSGDHSKLLGPETSWIIDTTPRVRSALGLTVDVLFSSPDGQGDLSFIGAGVLIDYQWVFLGSGAILGR